jgi:hypothetical protein
MFTLEKHGWRMISTERGMQIDPNTLFESTIPQSARIEDLIRKQVWKSSSLRNTICQKSQQNVECWSNVPNNHKRKIVQFVSNEILMQSQLPRVLTSRSKCSRYSRQRVEHRLIAKNNSRKRIPQFASIENPLQMSVWWFGCLESIRYSKFRRNWEANWF